MSSAPLACPVSPVATTLCPRPRESTRAGGLLAACLALALAPAVGCGDDDGAAPTSPEALVNQDPDGYYAFGIEEWYLDSNSETHDRWLGPNGEVMHFRPTTLAYADTAYTRANDHYDTFWACCLDGNGGTGSETLLSPEPIDVPPGYDAAWYGFTSQGDPVYVAFVADGYPALQIELSSDGAYLTEDAAKTILRTIAIY